MWSTSFDKIDEILSRVNREQRVGLSLLNSDGAITLRRELDIRDASDDSVVKREIRAMKEKSWALWPTGRPKRGRRAFTSRKSERFRAYSHFRLKQLEGQC